MPPYFARKHDPVGVISDLFDNPEDYGDREANDYKYPGAKVNSISYGLGVNKIPPSVIDDWSEFAISNLTSAVLGSGFYYGKWDHEERETLANAMYEEMPEAIRDITYDPIEHPIFRSVWKEFNNVYLKQLTAAQRMDFTKAIQDAELPDNYELSDGEIKDINDVIKNKFGKFSNQWRSYYVNNVISDKVKYSGFGVVSQQRDPDKKRRERAAGEEKTQQEVGPRMGRERQPVKQIPKTSGKILDRREDNDIINLSESYYLGYFDGRDLVKISQTSDEVYNPSWIINIEQKLDLAENLGQFDGVADGLLEAFSKAIREPEYPDADYIARIKPIHEEFKKTLREQNGNILNGLQSLISRYERNEDYLNNITTLKAFEALLGGEWRKINTNEELMKRISAIEKKYADKPQTGTQFINPFKGITDVLTKIRKDLTSGENSDFLRKDTTTEFNWAGTKPHVRTLIDEFIRLNESLNEIISEIGAAMKNKSLEGMESGRQKLIEEELENRLNTIRQHANYYAGLVEPLSGEPTWSPSASHLLSAFKRLEHSIALVEDRLKRSGLETAHYNPAKAGLISFSEWKLAYA